MKEDVFTVYWNGHFIHFTHEVRGSCTHPKKPDTSWEMYPGFWWVLVGPLTEWSGPAETHRSEGHCRPCSSSAGEKIQQPCTQEGEHRAAGGRSKFILMSFYLVAIAPKRINNYFSSIKLNQLAFNVSNWNKQWMHLLKNIYQSLIYLLPLCHWAPLL